MSELRALQESFWASLHGSPPRGFEREVCGNERALALHAEMYRWRLAECLALDFPALAGVLGHARFSSLADSYLDAFPSRAPSLRQFGRSLSGFVREPWLAELAALEWARVEVFDRADQPVVSDPRSLAAPPASLRIIHAHELLWVRHAIEPVWRSRSWHEPALAPHAILVWRKADGTVHHRPLADDEAQLLPALRRGMSFVELCQELLQRDPATAPYRAFELASAWCADELLASGLTSGGP